MLLGAPDSMPGDSRLPPSLLAAGDSGGPAEDMEEETMVVEKLGEERPSGADTLGPVR